MEGFVAEKRKICRKVELSSPLTSFITVFVGIRCLDFDD